ncbi:hypothetical protein TL16_g12884 [Triparma laevis f. inornata]|uniref:Uncharacterized protein n=2 Tax=Triparma laevis TaxID=1534972 RepID=A0A9W7AES7_9STRA|nr:hypothetical protein TrLO_g5878 [Triparma laevis f. longispina]GMH94358.1 hypothetical protein TL16_g12884 [Triparma laevis f. inornata]
MKVKPKQCLEISTQTPMEVKMLPKPTKKQLAASLIITLNSSLQTSGLRKSVSKYFSTWSRRTRDHACIQAVGIARRQGAEEVAKSLSLRVNNVENAVSKKYEERMEKVEKETMVAKEENGRLININEVGERERRGLEERVKFLETELREERKRGVLKSEELRREEERRIGKEEERREKEVERKEREKEVEALRGRVEEGRREKERKVEEIEALTLQIKLKESAVTRLNEEKINEERKFKSLVKDMEEEVIKIKGKSDRKILQLKTAFESIVKKAAGEKVKLDKLVDKSRESVVIIKSLREENKGLKKSLKSETAKWEEKEKENFKVNEVKEGEEIKKVKEYNVKLESLVEDVKLKQSKLEMSLKVKDVTIQELNKELKKVQGLMEGKEGLTLDLERIRRQRSELEEELEGKDDFIEELEGKIEGMNRESELKGERGGKILVEELDAEIVDLKEILKGKDEAISGIEREMIEGREEFEGKEKRLREEWKRDMENVRGRIDEERKGLRREREGFKVKLEESMKEEKRRKKKINALMERVEKVEREKRGLEGEVEGMKRLMGEKEERSRKAVENMYRQIVGVG